MYMFELFDYFDGTQYTTHLWFAIYDTCHSFQFTYDQ